MNPKTLARLAAGLGALVVATIVAAVLTQPPGPAPFAPESLAEKVTRIELEGPAGKIALKREKAGWSASAPTGFPADAATIELALGKLAQATVSEPLTEDPERYALFGFAATAATRVRLLAGDAPLLDFYLGKNGPDYPSVFVRNAKQTGVLQVSGMASQDWARAPGDWLNRAVFSGMAESVTAVSVRGSKASWELKQSSGGWQLNGKAVPAGSVEGLVRQAREAVGQLDADSVVEAAAAPKDAGLDKPELRVRAETKTGPVEFAVGKKNASGRRYLRKAGEARVFYLVADWRFAALERPAADFFKK